MSVAVGFRELHQQGLFVMPNAWDAGSARLFEHLGFSAIATTSSGHAASTGRLDQRVRRDELLAHAEQLVAAVSIPVSVDSEGCFPGEPGGVARTVELIAATGAAGCSIEDYDPASGIVPVDLAAERVAAAAGEASRHGLVLTARAENHIYDVDDLDDTIARLITYRDAGADVLYAPGLTSLEGITRLVGQAERPVNVLALGGIPPLADLAAAGVRRVSTGGSLAWVAYGAAIAAAEELRDRGTTSYLEATLASGTRNAAFRDRAEDHN